MRRWKRYALPLSVGLLGSMGLAIIYFGLVTWAESFEHARQLFWEDRAIVLPMILGFGVQLGLYTVLKKGLYVPIRDTGASGALTGASGGVSAAAMVACCAHHVTDLLPLIGLTAAATFLAEYRLAFMLVGLGTTIAGIAAMLVILLRERRKAVAAWTAAMEAS